LPASQVLKLASLLSSRHTSAVVVCCYIDWVLKASLDERVAPDDVVTDEAATLVAAKLKTPLQIGQHLVRAFEAEFEIGPSRSTPASSRRSSPTS
jgi:hypothetical protein